MAWQNHIRSGKYYGRWPDWREKMIMETDHYSYRIYWSGEDSEYVGLCAEFPSLSWLDKTPEAAFTGIRKTVSDVIVDLQTNAELIPEPIAIRHFSGKFNLRIPPELHRDLVLEAAEAGISLNRLASDILRKAM